MSYFTDPYSSPERHDLTLVGTVHRYCEAYEFDMVAVWVHDDGRIFWGQDSGCSCPSPFEGCELKDLDQVESWAELDAALKDCAPSAEWRSANDAYAVECAEIVLRVREMTRGTK